MIYPSPWMWAAGGLLVLLGLWQLRRSQRSWRRASYPPVWLCGLLVVVALVGVWFLLNAQFGGQAMQIHLP